MDFLGKADVLLKSGARINDMIDGYCSKVSIERVNESGMNHMLITFNSHVKVSIVVSLSCDTIESTFTNTKESVKKAQRMQFSVLGAFQESF
jgi:hypothetical protein